MKPDRPRSLIKVLLDLLLSLLPVLILVFWLLQLPWQVGVVLAIALFVALVPLVRKNKFEAASRVSGLLTALIKSLAISIMWYVPAYWNVLLAAVAMLSGVFLQAIWERLIGLVSTVPDVQRVEQRDGHPGASAWGGGEPTHTPEGEPIRICGGGEIAMGGPVVLDYLFPDGVFLQGLGSSACFSTDGRYFAAPLPSRQAWGLVVLDRHERRLYQSDFSKFWEIDAFTPETIYGRYSPLTSDQSFAVQLDELLADAQVVDLVAVQDLWLPADGQKFTCPTELELSAPPAGPHRLTATPYLPESLRTLDHPLQPLNYPAYRLAVDGQVSDLLISEDNRVLWRSDGLSLCCRARKIGSAETWAQTYWLWTPTEGWRALPAPWKQADDAVLLHHGEPLALDESAIRIDAWFDYPDLSQGRHGTRLDHIFSEVDTIEGYSPEGHMRTVSCKGTALQLMLSLNSQGGRGEAVVESAALSTGERAQLRWLFDRQDGQGIYSCCIGNWNLPGQWLLDHRVSNCGRYLALLPDPDAEAVSGAVVVVDVEQHQLIQSEPMLVVRLQDFRDGVLRLINIMGRRHPDESGVALHRVSESASEPGQASAFLSRDDGSDLVYQSVRLVLHENVLTPVPDWRLVDQPQVAVADGDFVYPAPNGTDAAWLFGAVTEYDDSWLREREPRMKAFLLTESGCALGGLSPSMMWSADGRYLALTRMLPERNEQGIRPWQLLLLELQTGQLYKWPSPIGNLPWFEHFDEKGLRIRVYESVWQAEEDQGESQFFSLQTLLQHPFMELLSGEGGLRVSPGQHKNLAWWQTLERSPLTEWRRQRSF